MKGPQASIAMLLFAGQLASGQAAEVDEGRRLLDEFLHDVKTFQGSFKQALQDADGQVIEEATGLLEIERPGKFRWSYIEPYEQWLVADGLNIWSYDVDLAQVTVKPQQESLANTPALLLSGSDEALEQFNYEGSNTETYTTWVQLAPKNTSSGFIRVKLGFIADTLSHMVFYDNLEQTTLIQLDEVAVNKPIDPERFRFTAPEGVDVVGVPAVAVSLDP